MTAEHIGDYDPWSPKGTPSAKKGKAGAKAPDLDAVAAALMDAETDGNALIDIGRQDPYPGQKFETSDGNQVAPGEWKPDPWGLPPDCPVLPLGTEDGVFFFLDTIGQMRALKESELTQAGITGLFMGRPWYLYAMFPKKNADGVVTSWRPEKVRETLTTACARKGSWSPLNSVRGRGMWRGRDGRLIVHCGDRLFSAKGEEPLGELEGKIYPTRPPVSRPWPVSLTGKAGPARVLYPHFDSWKWVRPKLDPVLLLGWIGVGYLGAAADNRPASYVLGDKATGKSALHNDMKALFGEWLINTGDTTSAGIYQLVKFDCTPVSIDEFEAKADNRKTKAVIELMRLSYTGAPMNRGGDNHKGTQFHGRSAFNFSSIVMPPMEPADLSRLAVLRLKRQPPGAVRPIIPAEEMAELGRKVLRRLIDGWHRYHTTLAKWREFLASCGHEGRGQDTFGTLMAVADIVIGEDAEALGLQLTDNSDHFEDWRALLSADLLSEIADASENWKLCLAHLMNKRIEAWRGGTRHTVGELLTEFWEKDIADKEAITFDQARRSLEQAGLALIKPRNREESFQLMVPHNNTSLYEVFRDSKWAGELGAGSWTGSLRQAPEDMWSDASARINGQKAKGTAFKLKDIIVSEEEARG